MKSQVVNSMTVYETTEKIDGDKLWASVCGQVFVLRSDTLDTLVPLGGLDSHGFWIKGQEKPPIEALRAIREVLTEDSMCAIEERYSDGETILFNRYKFGHLSTAGVWIDEHTSCTVQEWEAWLERKALDPCSGGFHLLSPTHLDCEDAASRGENLAGSVV